MTNHTNRITRPLSDAIDLAVRLLVEAAHPRKIILFGSYARGGETPESDVDLVVILPFVDNHFSEMVRLRRTLREMRMPIDVLLYSDEDVRTRGTWSGTALHDALHTGRVLYANG